MNWADRLEAWLGRAWDSRLKGRRGSLQPVQIARALEAELLAGKRVSILRTYVPNFYRVFLHPREWEDLKRIRRTLTAELVEYLHDAAEREGCAFVSPPQVEWQVAPEASPGRVRVAAEFLEPLSLEPSSGEAAAPDLPVALSPGDRSETDEALGEAEAPGTEPGREPEVWPPAPASRGDEAEEDLGDDSADWDDEELEPMSSPGAAAALAEEPAPAEATRRYRATPETEEPVGRLVVVEGPDRGTAYLLDGHEIVIGRASGGESVADLPLSDPAVSRRHARLLWRGGLWWLEDLGSTNGTYVNGDLIDSGWLQAGDHVGVGNSELLLEDEEPPHA